MLRRAAMMALPSIALGLPAAAQQAITDQEARQITGNILEAWNKAFQARDPIALAAQYTEDYVFVGPPPAGAMSGRAAMIKN